jgi:polygalacturonase
MSLPSFPQNLTITDFGAKGDGQRINTKSIQDAIDKCSREGGQVIVPAGVYKSGTIILKDNVTLFLENGAVLLASTDTADFPRQPQPGYRSQKDRGGWFALIYAEHAKNIHIGGSGVIDGNGAGQKARPGIFSGDLDGRPRNLLFISCKNIRVEGISMLNSGMWNQHYLDCEDVWVDNIKVMNHGNRNNDGIDIDGCRRFILANSIIDSDDDGIVLKSTGLAACEDVAINNCIVSSHTNAIKCGTESTGGFKNISISDCIINPSRVESGLHYPKTGISGISLEIVDGGVMDGVHVNNIVIDGTQCPIYVRLGNRARKYTEEAPAPPIGVMRNIQISDITAYNTGNYSSSITGIPGARIENIYLHNIRIVNSGGLKSGDYVHDVRQVDEDETAYPQPNIWGDLPSYGLFVRHVRNISISGASFTSIAPDPRWPIAAIDVDRLSIAGLEVNRALKGDRILIKSVGKCRFDNSVRAISY